MTKPPNEVEELRKRLSQVEQVLWAVIEACSYDHHDARKRGLLDASERMPK